jgi:hypothetical protein
VKSLMYNHVSWENDSTVILFPSHTHESLCRFCEDKKIREVAPSTLSKKAAVLGIITVATGVVTTAVTAVVVVVAV